MVHQRRAHGLTMRPFFLVCCELAGAPHKLMPLRMHGMPNPRHPTMWERPR